MKRPKMIVYDVDSKEYLENGEAKDDDEDYGKQQQNKWGTKMMVKIRKMMNTNVINGEIKAEGVDFKRIGKWRTKMVVWFSKKILRMKKTKMMVWISRMIWKMFKALLWNAGGLLEN